MEHLGHQKYKNRRLEKNISINDMDKFEKKEELTKSTWNDWLINYIPEPIRKSVGVFKDKIVSLFKTNTPK